jgi:hypothetical protein
MRFSEITQHKSRPAQPASFKMHKHVIDVFKRVLERDPDTRVKDMQATSATIHFRDTAFDMTVTVVNESLHVNVAKRGADMFANTFFRYNCPVKRLGKLRKTALLLQKKISLVEVFEVHDA